MRKDFTFTTEELYSIETAILNYNLILICPRLDFRLVKSQIDYYATDKFIKFVKDSYGYEIDEFLYQLIGWRLLTDFKKFVEYLDNPEEIVKEAMEEKIEIDSRDEPYYENNIQYTKEQLSQNLGFSMLLNKPSGLTLDQFKQIFENDSNDKNNVFKDNAEYFYYVESQYNINGIFVAAVAIHESGWGTSSISKNKK